MYSHLPSFLFEVVLKVEFGSLVLPTKMVGEDLKHLFGESIHSQRRNLGRTRAKHANSTQIVPNTETRNLAQLVVIAATISETSWSN